MQIEPLSKLHDRTDFDCGSPPLNEYLKKYALQNQRKDASRTYVLADDRRRVLGFYSVAFGSVGYADADAELAAGLGRYPIPILLIARLAVDNSQKGKRLGELLLRDALLRAVSAADIAGLRAVVVDAKDDAAVAFYRRYGFVSSNNDAFAMYMSLSTIRKSLA